MSMETKSGLDDNDRPIVFFDGVCNLCNSSVTLLIKLDKKERFLFASLQSEIAEALLAKYDNPGDPMDSIVLLHNDKMSTRSDAVLRICSLLGGGWKALSLLRVIPKGWRDALYKFIAKNRYRWFGRKDQCMIPSPELRNRFL